MKTLFILFFLLSIFNPSYSQESQLQKDWTTIRIPYNYILSQDLAQGDCYNSETVSLIKNKNNKDLNELWAENYLNIPRCHNKKLFVAQDNKIYKKSKIKEWKQIVAPKGFILSVALVENKCTNIWKKHMDLFREKNPHVKNLNRIEEGEKITLQYCEEKTPSSSKAIKYKQYSHTYGLMFGGYRKNSTGPYKSFGGAFLDIGMSDIVSYEMNAYMLNKGFLMNNFRIGLDKNRLFSGGITLINEIGDNNAYYYFLRYKKRWENKKVTVQIGTNFSEKTFYSSTRLFYKRTFIFHKFFEIPENNNDYHLLGLGYAF